jgi:hypothetical protein
MWNPFKKKVKEPPFNIYHPEVADKIEFAFEAGPVLRKKKFYRFKLNEDFTTTEFEHRTGRYIWIESYLRQAGRKMDDQTLSQYIEKMKFYLSGKVGEVDLVKAVQILITMEAWTKTSFSPELIKRLASVVYFDETEDLRSYNKNYGENKILFWEKYDKDLNFFLSKPIVEWFNLKNLSVKYLQSYIQEREQMIADLTLDTQTQ